MAGAYVAYGDHGHERRMISANLFISDWPTPLPSLFRVMIIIKDWVSCLAREN